MSNELIFHAKEIRDIKNAIICEVLKNLLSDKHIAPCKKANKIANIKIQE